MSTARSTVPPETRVLARRLSNLVLLISSLGLVSITACTTTNPNSAGGAAHTLPSLPAEPVALTSDGMQVVDSSRRKHLWVRPDHHIGRYDNVLVTGIGFAYQKGQERLNAEQEAELGQILAGAIGRITVDGPVGPAAEAGPCVVALQVGLRDIVLHITKEQPGSSISFVSSFGSATMIVEFRDSTTKLPLVRYAVNRGLGGGPGTGQVGANLDRLGDTLGQMVTDMTTELQTIVPSTTVRPETECNDGIYRLTGRD
jgi:hypothetical protein